METVFLGCFLFGLLFTLVSAALGAAGHALPNLHGGHGGDVGHGSHLGHGHAGDGGHAGHGHGDSTDGRGNGLPLLNASSLMAFLMWFGAGGYVLERFVGLPASLAIAGGVAAGTVGAVIVALVLRAILAGERVMDPRDYQLEGTIARVTVTIPEGGAGEIVYTKAGSRRGEAARSLDGKAVPRETEVVIIEYERGIAAVQPWDQFIARESRSEAAGSLPAPGGES